MHLYRARSGNFVTDNNSVYKIEDKWDDILASDNLRSYLKDVIQKSSPATNMQTSDLAAQSLAPIGMQEVWAAGVTYLRSRDARMEESKESGGADCYQKVYTADRPEIFFKALPHRVAAPNEAVYIRKDSTWNVPEPELTLFINSSGSIQAYTIGNDMSSRSIEGENPLYLPQAKMYERSAALGPCLYVPENSIDLSTNINLVILRSNENVFEGNVQLKQMKRQFAELATWLFAETKFPHGCFLMTGTGIIPPDHFTLQHADVVRIAIDNIGVLTNTVEVSPAN
jgi:2-dehydro-3-deoxy-D-arabinonate dehydratase